MHVLGGILSRPLIALDDREDIQGRIGDGIHHSVSSPVKIFFCNLDFCLDVLPAIDV